MHRVLIALACVLAVCALSGASVEAREMVEAETTTMHTMIEGLNSNVVAEPKKDAPKKEAPKKQAPKPEKKEKKEAPKPAAKKAIRKKMKVTRRKIRQIRKLIGRTKTLLLKHTSKDIRRAKRQLAHLSKVMKAKGKKVRDYTPGGKRKGYTRFFSGEKARNICVRWRRPASRRVRRSCAQSVVVKPVAPMYIKNRYRYHCKVKVWYQKSNKWVCKKSIKIPVPFTAAEQKRFRNELKERFKLKIKQAIDQALANQNTNNSVRNKLANTQAALANALSALAKARKNCAKRCAKMMKVGKKIRKKHAKFASKQKKLLKKLKKLNKRYSRQKASL